MKTKLPVEDKMALTVNPNFQFKRILVPLDFSTGSQKALVYAKALAELFGSQLVLIHVVEPFYPTGDFPLDFARMQIDLEQSAKTGLEKYRRKAGPGTKTIVRVGSPAHAITEEAKQIGADLIVLATHGRTGLSHFALGSVAERVIRHAPCPTLIVREKEHEFIVTEPQAAEWKRAAREKKTVHKLMEAL